MRIFFAKWNAYRTAAVLLLLYCILHSYGALIATPDFGAQSDAVIRAMRSVHFTVQEFWNTWYGFYLGFGWFASIFFALSAVELWIIGGIDRAQQQLYRSICWTLAIAHAVGVGLCIRYFFAAPLLFSSLATIAIVWGLLSDRRIRRAEA